jgi:hypothetical protein
MDVLNGCLTPPELVEERVLCVIFERLNLLYALLRTVVILLGILRREVAYEF